MNLSELCEPWAGDVELAGGRVVLLLGRMELRLCAFPPEFIHASIGDPPYHLQSIVKRFGGQRAAPPKPQKGEAGLWARKAQGFMRQNWDGGKISFQAETWAAHHQVLLPGAHVIESGGARTFHRIGCAIEDGGFEVRDSIDWIYGTGNPRYSLKPAHEPFILGRKSCRESSVRKQMARTGTGSLNYGDCMVKGADRDRFPPNVVFAHHLDCAEDCLEGCPVEMLGDKARFFPIFRYEPKPTTREREAGLAGLEWGHFQRVNTGGGLEDDPKWCAVNRKNTHATVKPLGLMRWLVRLGCPPDGIVLDAFMGSGTTGAAAVLEGRRFIGIEMDPKYFEIAVARVKHAIHLAGL